MEGFRKDDSVPEVFCFVFFLGGGLYPILKGPEATILPGLAGL